MSEIGIPYDMGGKKAYVDGKYIDQYAAMDANNFALENAGLNYTLWCYCSSVESLISVINNRTLINGEISGMAKICRFGAKMTRRRTLQIHSKTKRLMDEIVVSSIPTYITQLFTITVTETNRFPQI